MTASSSSVANVCSNNNNNQIDWIKAYWKQKAYPTAKMKTKGHTHTQHTHARRMNNGVGYWFITMVLLIVHFFCVCVRVSLCLLIHLNQKHMKQLCVFTCQPNGWCCPMRSIVSIIFDFISTLESILHCSVTMFVFAFSNARKSSEKRERFGMLWYESLCERVCYTTHILFAFFTPTPTHSCSIRCLFVLHIWPFYFYPSTKYCWLLFFVSVVVVQSGWRLFRHRIKFYSNAALYNGNNTPSR